MSKVIIDNAKRTVTADLKKLTPAEMDEVKMLSELGYTFIQKINKRSGVKRNREFYESNLRNEDLEIFKTIEKKNSYQKAISFAAMIIKLGKMVDQDPDKKFVLDDFRIRAVDDMCDAKLYFEDVMAA